jgi:osmotically-inducible protein OsmY
MRGRTLGCAAALVALTLAPAACNRRGDGPDGDHRVDKQANERAASVTNSTDNREGEHAGAVRDDKDTAGTSGTLNHAADQASQAVADSGITLKVQAKFLEDDVVKARRIDVDTQGGVVTLAGVVQSKAERDKAEQLARETDGVKRVVNNLKLAAM